MFGNKEKLREVSSNGVEYVEKVDEKDIDAETDDEAIVDINREVIPGDRHDNKSGGYRADGIDQMSEVSAFSTEELDRLKLLYQGVPNRKLLNVFRDLRTKLAKKSKGKNYVCLVTSLVAGGGASYIAANLSAAIAMDRTKTSLLIDGNLYAPSVERLLAVEPVNGLTDYLYREDSQVEEIVYASGIPRLRVIPVGNNREAGAEYFSTGRMRKFIDSVKSRYPDRFIIIDSPPACEYSAETHILADLSDFVVLVVPYGKVTESQITAGLETIGEDRLAGVVYNN